MKASTKDILRELKKSGMRFFYICAIIALGVAFFCGIKATSPSMIQTAVDYFNEYDLSDFRLLSTYGFRDKDIVTLSQVDGVEQANGAYSMDVIMNVADEKEVVKIMSLPEPGELNQPILKEGRFPQAVNECVVETPQAHLKNTAIGNTINVLSESQDEETLNHLRSREFTIVGFVETPQYISIERGNTTISDGTIDGYMFIEKSAFDYERFTEAYVYTDISAEGTHPYSDDYSEAQEQMAARLEEAGNKILEDNVGEIRVEALKKINEAQETLDENRKTFNSEIASAYQQIEDGRAQLQEGYAQYESGVVEYNTQIAAAEEQITSGQAEIDSGFAQLEVGRAQLASEILNGQNKLLEGKNQLEQGYLSYNKGLAEFNNKINQAEAELAEAEDQLEEGFSEYNENKKLFEAQKALALKEIAAGEAQISAGYDEYYKGRELFETEIAKAQAALDQAWDAFEEAYEWFKNQQIPETPEIPESPEPDDEVVEELLSVRAKIVALQDERDTLEQQLQAHQSSYNSLIAENEIVLPELDQKIIEDQALLNTLEDQRVLLKEEYDPLFKKLTELEEQLKDLNLQITEKESLVKNYENTISETSSRITEIDSIDSSERDEKEREKLSEKIDLNNQEIEQLKPEIESLSEKRENKNQEIGEINKQFESPKTQLNLLNQQIDALSDQIKKNQDEYIRREDEVQFLANQIDQDNSDLGENADQMQEFQEKLTELMQLLASIPQNPESASTILPMVNAGLQEMQEAFNAYQAQGEATLQASLKKLQSAQAEITSAKAQLAAGEKQLKEALEQLQAGKNELEEGKKLLAEQKEAGQQELDAALSVLKESELELIAGEAELEKGRIEGEKELETAYQELQTGQETLDAGKQELAIQRVLGRQQLEAALNLLIDSQNQLSAGLSELEFQRADGERQLQEAQEQIDSSRTEINDLDQGKWYVYDRDDNPGYTGYQEDAERIDNVGNVFPLFFFLVAALVAFTTMTRMVEEERTQIGTLYALGYSRAQIIKKYVIYAGTAALIGSTVGWIVGVLLLPVLIFTAYNILYEMPDLVLEIPWSMVIISYIVAILCTVGAAVLIALHELRSVPAELMRPKAPKPGKRILLERMPIIWNKLNFITKVSLRNIFRYKARFLMTVIGIAGCTALILAGFGLHDAIFAIIPNQFGTIFKYDQTLIVKENDTNIADKLAKVIADERVSGAMPADQKSITVSTDQGTLNAYLIVPQDPEHLYDYIGLHERLSPDDQIQLTDSGVVVSEKLATNYGAYPGDSVNLTIDNEKYEAKVTAQTENYLQNYIYMTPNLYKEITGQDPNYEVIFVNFKDNVTEEADQQQFAADMIETGDYTSAINVATTIETSNKTMQSLNVLVIVMIVSAGMLAFIVLNNLTNINISERIREIATLKVLGFRRGETNNYIFRENLILSVFGIALGIILGLLLLKFIILTVELDIIMFGREVMPLSYVYAILLTLGFTIIVNFSTIPTMNRINMVEALKDID